MLGLWKIRNLVKEYNIPTIRLIGSGNLMYIRKITLNKLLTEQILNILTMKNKWQLSDKIQVLTNTMVVIALQYKHIKSTCCTP